MKENHESKLTSIALSNRQVAVAILGQALLDEGSIGERGICVSYVSRGEAEHLWKTADSLGYTNPLRRKDHKTHFHWWFSIKASKTKELYDEIGPLPNPVKDTVFRHLANRYTTHIRPRGETRKLILKVLKQKTQTILQLMLEVDASYSTVREHLKKLRELGLVRICGKYTNAQQKSRRLANLWTAK